MKDAGVILKYGLFLIVAMGMFTYGCSGANTAMMEQPSGELAKLENLTVTEGEDTTTVLIELNKPVNFTTVRVDDPPTVVVDLAGVDMKGSMGLDDVYKNPVVSVEKTVDGEMSHIGRVSIALNSPVNADVSIEGSTIVVKLDKSQALMAVPESMGNEDAVSVAEVAVGRPAVEAVSEPEAVQEEPAAEPAAEAVLADATMVHDVVVGEDDGSISVAIRGDGRFAEPKAFMLDYDDNIRLVVDVFGVDAYTDKDSLVVGDGLLSRVRMAAHDEPEKKFRVVLDLNGKAVYDVKAIGGDVVIALAPEGGKAVATGIGPSPYAVAMSETSENSQSARSAAQTAETRVETKMETGREITVSATPPPAVADEGKGGIDIFVSQVDGKTILSSSPLPGAQARVEKAGTSKSGVVETKNKIYTGGKISFDLQEAELDKVIKLLADVAGLNLLMNPSDVKGSVTIKLQNVPWDQALDILLKLYDLDKVIEGNVLRVAPGNKLKAEEKRDLKERKEMMKLIEESQELYTKTFKVSYVDAEKLQGKVKKLLSKRGEITANESTNEIIVTDVLDNLDEVEELIKLLDKRVNQIMIEARIVTVESGFTQSLGVSWGITKGWKGRDQGAVGINSTHGISAEDLDNDTYAETYLLQIPDELGFDVAGMVTGWNWLISGDEMISLDLTLSALETISKAETLAAPKVVTLENEKAEITQGTVLYIQTTSAAGTRPEPLNANLSLTVTPRVTGDNYIMMDVEATNNTPGSPPPGSAASINTQAVKTNVIVKDGDTLVLGGIYTKTDDTGDAQVPWVGRIPIIGWLFKERNINQTTRELLIFITPKIVRTNSYEA